MHPGSLRAALVAFALMTFATGASAADETISVWTTGITPISLNMSVGDTLTWDTFSASHTANLTPAGLCDFTGSTQLDTAGVGASYQFTAPGTYTFGCAIGSHCASSGMSVTVEVAAAAPTLSLWALGGTATLLMGMIEVARRRRSSSAFS